MAVTKVLVRDEAPGQQPTGSPWAVARAPCASHHGHTGGLGGDMQAGLRLCPTCAWGSSCPGHSLQPHNTGGGGAVPGGSRLQLQLPSILRSSAPSGSPWHGAGPAAAGTGHPTPASPPPDLCPCGVDGRNGCPRSSERPGYPGRGEAGLSGALPPVSEGQRHRGAPRAGGLTQTGVQPRGGASSSGLFCSLCQGRVTPTARRSLLARPLGGGPATTLGSTAFPAGWTRGPLALLERQHRSPKGHRSRHGGGLPGQRPQARPEKSTRLSATSPQCWGGAGRGQPARHV